MATAGQTAVNERDLCDVVRSWPLCAKDGPDHVVLTHCQLPNGSLLKVRIHPMGGDTWVVSDGGAAFDEALSSGAEMPSFGLNVRRAIRAKGLSFVDGRIESPKVTSEALFTASVIVANAARDIAETLLVLGDAGTDQSLERRTRKILVSRFHSWVLSKPVTVNGASERPHKFENVLDLPDGRRLLVDVVRHQGNSINAAVVANLDVRRLEDPNIVQRIVFDPEEKWKREEIELLEVGAVPVELPSLAGAIQRMAA